MAFPDTTYTSNAAAASGLVNKAGAAGLDLSGLQPLAQLQSAVANLLVSDPSTVTVPAGDISAGTFGANIVPADTGLYTFPGQLTVTAKINLASTIAITATGLTFQSFQASGANAAAGDYTFIGPQSTGNATPGTWIFQTTSAGGAGSVAQTETTVLTLGAATVGATGSLSFTTSAFSTTALATPAALVATRFSGFASTVSGAVLMGFGTTGDVTLKNRAGTDVIVVTSNTLNVTMAGALAMTGALSGVTTLVASSTISFTGGTYTTSLSSVTALATPGAYIATTGTFFASTVSGATLMGFGTTGDVTLKNRAGTDAIVVTANTVNVTMAGALAITGALSGVTTLAIAGALTGATTITGSTTLTLNATTTSAILIGSVSSGQVSIGRAALVQPLMSGAVASLGTVQNSTPTIAQLLGGIVTQTSVTGAGTVTLPTGTAMSTGVTGVTVGDTFDCTFFNLGGGFTLTITGDTGSTVVGNAEVPSAKAVLLRCINTGSNAWSIYCSVGA